MIVAHTFFAKLSPYYKGFHISYRNSRVSYARALASHALCLESGLLLPTLFLRNSHLGPSCIMPRVGIIVVQSREAHVGFRGLTQLAQDVST